jgi:hypothetical protein
MDANHPRRTNFAKYEGTEGSNTPARSGSLYETIAQNYIWLIPETR